MGVVGMTAHYIQQQGSWVNAYQHALVLGTDGVTRCTICRAAAYDPVIIDGIPCKDGHYRGVAIRDTEEYGEIISGAEPPWPRLGDFWLESRSAPDHDMFWVWADLGDGIQDWVDLDTNLPRDGENRLPNTKHHPMLKAYEARENVTEEMYAQVGSMVTEAVVNRLREIVKRDHLAQVSPINLLTEPDPAMKTLMVIARMWGRPIHPSIRNRIENIRLTKGYKPFRGANASLI